jgi:UDP-2,3-diacylglucosamine pyrophosphatase LpxH
MSPVDIHAIHPMSLADGLDYAKKVAHERGIAAFIPGDVHLWGKSASSCSDVLQLFLDEVSFDHLVLNGDTFDANRYERRTLDDERVLDRIRALDAAERVHFIRGNHDHHILGTPHIVAERARATGANAGEDVPDLGWLRRPRMQDNVVFSMVDGALYFGDAHTGPGKSGRSHEEHPGSHDVLVLRLGGKNILFEHGDAHDRLVDRRYTEDSLIGEVSSFLYNVVITLERAHEGISDISGYVKGQLNKWRGVCDSVAFGATEWRNVLNFDLHGTVCGHTHNPTWTMVNGLPHVNAGGMRGLRPSFAMVTADTGDLLPPVVVRYE